MNDAEIGKALIAQIDKNNEQLKKIFANADKLRAIAHAAANVIKHRQDEHLDCTVYPYVQLADALFAMLKDDDAAN